MKKKQFRGEYLAPEVKVMEMKVQQHILQTSLDRINCIGSSWDDESSAKGILSDDDADDWTFDDFE